MLSTPLTALFVQEETPSQPALPGNAWGARAFVFDFCFVLIFF